MIAPRPAAVLACLMLGGCAGSDLSALQSLRQRTPVAVLEVDASPEAVEACLSDDLRRRGFRVAYRTYPDDRRSTITGYSGRRQHHRTSRPDLDYEVLQVEAEMSRIVLRRAEQSASPEVASIALRSTIARCGLVAPGGQGGVADGATIAGPSIE